MISIIIPTCNEQENIKKLIGYLKDNSLQQQIEIIVSDGGSTDGTMQAAIDAGANAAVLSPKKGRAPQMNYGASVAGGNCLYFIHADALPPATFISDIENAFAAGFEFGRYRTKFDSSKKILYFNAFFTRFDLFMCYGGDQTFFIKKDLFKKIGGFDDTMLIMEDYEIVSRAKKHAKYKIIQKGTLVSARKYDSNSWLKVQAANYRIIQLFKKGASQEMMHDMYKRMLKYR